MKLDMHVEEVQCVVRGPRITDPRGSKTPSPPPPNDARITEQPTPNPRPPPRSPLPSKMICNFPDHQGVSPKRAQG